MKFSERETITVSTTNQESETPQLNEMSRMKETVRAHAQRDLGTIGQWICKCEDCDEMRSLIGVQKMFDVRPLVREISGIEEQLNGMPESAERNALTQKYLSLLDQLADVMAK